MSNDYSMDVCECEYVVLRVVTRFTVRGVETLFKSTSFTMWIHEIHCVNSARYQITRFTKQTQVVTRLTMCRLTIWNDYKTDLTEIMVLRDGRLKSAENSQWRMFSKVVNTHSASSSESFYIGQTCEKLQCPGERWGAGVETQKMCGERLGDGVEYHLMKPTPRR